MLVALRHAIPLRVSPELTTWTAVVGAPVDAGWPAGAAPPVRMRRRCPGTMWLAFPSWFEATMAVTEVPLLAAIVVMFSPGLTTWTSTREGAPLVEPAATSVVP